MKKYHYDDLDDFEPTLHNEVDADNGDIKSDLLSALRDELKHPEPERGSIDFRYNGVNYECVPMLEINPDKFVFKMLPNNELKTFKLSDIQIITQ